MRELVSTSVSPVAVGGLSSRSRVSVPAPPLTTSGASISDQDSARVRAAAGRARCRAAHDNLVEAVPELEGGVRQQASDRDVVVSAERLDRQHVVVVAREPGVGDREHDVADPVHARRRQRRSPAVVSTSYTPSPCANVAGAGVSAAVIRTVSSLASRVIVMLSELSSGGDDLVAERWARGGGRGPRRRRLRLRAPGCGTAPR